MEWKRVRPNHRCPVCDHATWCTFADDGSAAKCMRIASPKSCNDRAGAFCGWLHILDGTIKHARAVPPRRVIRDFTPQARAFFACACHRAGMAKALADSLGVSMLSLVQLRMGWASREDLAKLGTRCRGAGAWSFPMRLHDGKIVGIRLRSESGKFAVTGSQEGLFYSPGHNIRRGAVIVEGPTDAAALIMLGFQAIGRPSCRGAVIPTAKMCRGREVVIIGDFDQPDAKGHCAGQEGAQSLREHLKPSARSVRLCWPPEGFKDVREWVKAGADKQTVLRHIFDTAQ